MNNENQTIRGIDVDLICEFFLNTQRQGPGNPEATLRALSFIDGLTDDSRIADLGCGTGGQTMTLARHAPGHVTGLDFYPGFIERFNANARGANFGDRVKGVVGSMDDLPFREGELDLIWSEGAIYNIGFERGLREWRRKGPGAVPAQVCGKRNRRGAGGVPAAGGGAVRQIQGLLRLRVLHCEKNGSVTGSIAVEPPGAWRAVAGHVGSNRRET